CGRRCSYRWRSRWWSLRSKVRWSLLLSALVGLAVLAGPLFLLWFVMPSSMGFGDVRLATLLGWNVGFYAGTDLFAPVILGLITMTIAAIVGILLGVVGLGLRGRKAKVPFGPALVISAYACIVLSSQILEPLRPLARGAAVAPMAVISRSPPRRCRTRPSPRWHRVASNRRPATPSPACRAPCRGSYRRRPPDVGRDDRAFPPHVTCLAKDGVQEPEVVRRDDVGLVGFGPEVAARAVRDAAWPLSRVAARRRTAHARMRWILR
ncbi:MAG: A24 family peptidase, partial [Microthrixaceae bacterium]|nr:A24 family peptidase [Microthrixaceae bacterium]